MNRRELIILGSGSQQPTRARNHVSFLLLWNKEGFLFDPGEGTQRQFIFSKVAPTTITKIFISHFHGDHCLGLPSILMRLNLDGVVKTVDCFFPASGLRYFRNLCYSASYKNKVKIIEHPIYEDGLVFKDNGFTVHSKFLSHSIDCLGWRIQEDDEFKYDKEKLKLFNFTSFEMQLLEKQGFVIQSGKKINRDILLYKREGEVISIIMDTKLCKAVYELSLNVKILLIESTYLSSNKELAEEHSHMSINTVLGVALNNGIKNLILTHFSARYNMNDFKESLITAREIFPNTFFGFDTVKFMFPKNKTNKEKFCYDGRNKCFILE